MMLNTFLAALLLAATSLASQHHHHPEAEKRQEAPTAAPTPTSSIDYGNVKSMLNSYAKDMSFSPLAPSPSVTLGVSIPENLRKDIMTAVPPSILVQLMNPGYRSSVASGFQEGTTPKWFDDLDPDLKTFFEDMAEKIRTGDAVVTRTSAPSATETGEAEGETRETSTSEDPAVPTGADSAIMAGAIGMAGILGLALAL